MTHAFLCERCGRDVCICEKSPKQMNPLSRAELESMNTAELLRLKMLVTQIVADREATDGVDIRLRKPSPEHYLTLVKLVREAMGVGLREAKDMVDCGTLIRVAYPELAGRILKLLDVVLEES